MRYFLSLFILNIDLTADPFKSLGFMVGFDLLNGLCCLEETVIILLKFG